MKDSRIYWLLLMGLTAGLLACKQPVDFLPPATQAGSNTLGFLIDGKPYIPKGSWTLFTQIKPVNGGLVSRDSGRGLGVRFRTYTSTDDNGSVAVYLDDCRLGIHPLSNGNWSTRKPTDPRHYATYARGAHYFYSTDAPSGGWVNLLKVDSVSGVVAGTFEFVLADDMGKTVTITSGRFDLNALNQ